MTLENFRLNHSTLIEHYQYIEAHLEGIYATISGKNLLEGLKDVERSNFKHIISKIKTLESKEKINIFTEEEYEYLNKVFQKRNFWCHNCYYDIVFDRKTGGPKKPEDVQMLIKDLQEAEQLREKLFNKKIKLSKNSNSLLYF